jgi:hypothetical protein
MKLNSPRAQSAEERPKFYAPRVENVKTAANAVRTLNLKTPSRAKAVGWAITTFGSHLDSLGWGPPSRRSVVHSAEAIVNQSVANVAFPKR